MYSKQELHEIFQDLYDKKQDTITIAEICKELKTSQQTLHKNILAVNGYEDCPDVFMHIKKPIHVFDTLTKESAYWIGYIMADGCIAAKAPKNENQNTTYRLMLECKESDKEILEKFCEYIGIRKKRITSGHKGASVALSMTTSVFTTPLEIYGLVPNKSYVENHVPEIILSNPDLLFQFLRGIIDGDGTIHTDSRSLGVSFVTNSFSLANEIKEKLEEQLPEPGSIWLMERTPEQQNKNGKGGGKATQSLYQLKIGSGKDNRSNLKFLYNKFYTGQKIILTRKEKALKSLIA